MPKRILLVDDDIDDQMIVRSAIEMIEPAHECTFASDGREAIEHIEKTRPYDIVLLDLNMPLMNGFDTLKTIKKVDGYKDIPVVIISTSTFKYDIDRCKRLGAARYIVKPDNFPALIDELRQILTQ